MTCTCALPLQSRFVLSPFRLNIKRLASYNIAQTDKIRTVSISYALHSLHKLLQRRLERRQDLLDRPLDQHRINHAKTFPVRIRLHCVF